jgi:regulator of sigma E protease
MLTTLLSFIVVIGIIILVHELGHFLAARSCGIRVKVFSIGFGPTITSWIKGDTEYRLAWIPLGGYVQMAGMIDESLDSEDSITGAPDEFMSKNTLQKAFVISAGVIMNMLLAFVIYVLLAWIWGAANPSNEAVIGGRVEGMPAALAGIEAGDRIFSVAGETVHSWEELASAIHQYPEQEIELGYLRAADTLFVSLVPNAGVLPEKGKVGLIGIEPEYEIQAVGPLEGVLLGAQKTWMVTRMASQTITSLVTAEAGLKDLGGPIMIAQMSGESARSGVMSFLAFIAFISINIGFLNILPIPVLDGGHLVYILIEAVIGRPIAPKVKLWIQQAGMVLILLLMLIVMKNDIQRIITGSPDTTEEQVEP